MVKVMQPSPSVDISELYQYKGSCYHVGRGLDLV